MARGSRGDGPLDPDIPAAVDDAFAFLFRNSTVNAVIAWLAVAVLGGVVLDSALDVDLRWLVFTGAVGVIVAVPPVVFRSWRTMLPWELLCVGLLPILVRGLFGGTVGTFAVYVSLAAVALVVVGELHTFTSLAVTHWFAAVLVVLVTLASGAVWAVFRWTADQHFGTAYLTTNHALMTEFVWVTLAGLAAGVLFALALRRRTRWLRRATSRVTEQ
ncbi:hypothetical protein KVP02_05960 [Halobacterium salinarum]|uniref:hypothetical protein n=1 Tax=Halobacterium salinarum TaxID=2242 RepID=UPI001F269E4C|nr:hypothetical protein [Halobacterium salinarum]MCF2207203.1 hypothetical protein [Halobacterium salinarum]